jgi:predicted AAA+ superfamily ATPase
MPHFRPRHLLALIQKTLRFSPITGIFGHRQVGKTMFSERLAGNYVTFDQFASVNQASIDPEGLLNSHSGSKKPLVVDECQLAPPLFPALKDWVRVHTKPGQFLLTGSVRFSSRKAIAESLTGRIIAWELLPMDLSEAHEASLPDSLVRIAKAKTVDVDLKNKKYFSEKSYNEYLAKGGLPGVFSIRDTAIREQKFETQLNTLLERDLKLVMATTLPYSSLKLLLSALAQRQSHAIDLTLLSRQAHISVPTIKKLLVAFEAIFLIRILKTEGTEAKSVVFFEDQGEATYLVNGNMDEQTNLLRFCFANFRVQFKYRSEIKSEFFQYRNRGGAHIPLALHVSFEKIKSTLGFVPILGSTPGQHDLASAYSFLKKYPTAKVLFVTRDSTDHCLSEKMRIIPVAKLV